MKSFSPTLSRFAFIIGVLAISVSANAQGLTSMGLDYWVGFMPNYWAPAEDLRLFIASPTPNIIDVEVYGGSSQPTHNLLVMLGDSIATVDLSDPGSAETRSPEVVDYRAIHVHAIAPIAVYGLSNKTYTSDGYLALPRQILDTEYYSSCFYDDRYNEQRSFGVNGGPLAGEFLIVAPHDSTVITIHNVTADTRIGMATTYGGSDTSGVKDTSGLHLSHHIGDTWSVTLNQGQTYLVQSTGEAFGVQDLSGTLVTGSKPFSFLSGHQRCSVPIGAYNDSKDHLIEMLPPVNRWGKQYYDQPTPYRIGGDKIRFIAGDENTTVSANGKVVATLFHAGDWADIDQVAVPTVLTSNGTRFLAIQYTYTQYEYGDTAQTDPFMLVLPSEQQFQKHIFFRTPPNLSWAGLPYTHYLTVVGPSDSLQSVTINERAIGTYQQAKFRTFAGSTMGSATCQLPGDSAYIIESKVPVGAWSSGTSFVDSYGWPVGMLLNLPSDDTVAPVASLVQTNPGALSLMVQDQGTNGIGIAEVELIANAGDTRYPQGSTNVKLESPEDLIAGTPTYSCALSLVDASKSGDAALWLIDRSGNAAIQTFHIDANPSGVRSGSSGDLALSVSPNPATNRVSVLMPSSSPSIQSITLYDMTGKKIKQLGRDVSTLDVSGLANGTYSILITTTKGILSAKFVVNH